MRPSSKTVSILISLVLSAGMVGSAYLLSGNTTPNTAVAESTRELLKAYAAKDTDGDLLNDWQEELYGTDPSDPNSVDPDMTDREAVDAGKVEPKFQSDTSVLDAVTKEPVPGIEAEADSLTDQFAKEFFQDYLLGNGAQSVPTGEDLQAFVDTKIGDTSLTNAPKNTFTSNSIRTVPGGAAALRTYAAAVEDVGNRYGLVTDRSEAYYFDDVIRHQDKQAIEMVRKISASYETMADALIDVPVPEEAASAHLRAVNSMSKVGVLIGYIGHFDSDPLLGFVGLASYEASVIEFAQPLADMHAIYERNGVLIAPGEPGYHFYQLMETAHNGLANSI